MDPFFVNVVILVGVLLGLIWLWKNYNNVMSVSQKFSSDDHKACHAEDQEAFTRALNDSKFDWALEKDRTLETYRNIRQEKLVRISGKIEAGAQTFLYSEYKYMAYFMLAFSAVLFVFLGLGVNWTRAIATVAAFILGSLSSIGAGYLGMHIAVSANSRTTAEAYRTAPDDLASAFNVAYKAGSVMGFGLVAIALLMLFLVVVIYSLYIFPTAFDGTVADTQMMFESVAGFGLGGSSIALFGRVGGGIYTKAADVGADQVKLDGLEEDDPRNPAVIADNVGDNVGDIAGMGADLFGSLAETSCAAMVISASSPDVHKNWAVMCFPILLIAVSIPPMIFTSLFATDILPPKTTELAEGVDRESANFSRVMQVLKLQLVGSTVLMTPIVYLIVTLTFPAEFAISDVAVCTPFYIFVCVTLGLWSGLGIGLKTEEYTASDQKHVQYLASQSEQAAINIIQGLALGYESVIVPMFFLALTIYINYYLAGMYGVACGALGMLSTLSIALTVDAYGPICDNAGGIAEMVHMPKSVRDYKTDPLDSAGNTTAAIGKGFAIGSAALCSLSLFGAFVTVKLPVGAFPDVNVMDSLVFAGVLLGAMLPYWFSAMTMKSVGAAAKDMVVEVYRQFSELDLLNDSSAQPDYEKCVKISTEASLAEMIAPGALVMLSPLLCGYLFGPRALAGLLVGILTSGVQVAISASNSGGAWDNAKKLIKTKDWEEGVFEDIWKEKVSQEKPKVPEKESPEAKQKRVAELEELNSQRKAAQLKSFRDSSVTGDTVGDPLKDTSGPAINILVKLSAITSLVFASSMPGWDEDGYLVRACQSLFN
jgi:inorganic pyrophosphatase